MARGTHRRPPERPSRRRARRSPPEFVAPAAPEPRRVDLSEDPHAHIVCRNCGRIQSIELSELDRHLLTELANRHPDGWSVDGIAYSATGACRRCREGPPA
jgi:Fe2+ or Zn2+ uptake regulation protein